MYTTFVSLDLELDLVDLRFLLSSSSFRLALVLRCVVCLVAALACCVKDISRSEFGALLC